jgi:hypothetical protein
MYIADVASEGKADAPEVGGGQKVWRANSRVPVALVRVQKTGIKYKKPTCNDFKGPVSSVKRKLMIESRTTALTDPKRTLSGQRVESSLLSPGFHLGASCFLPTAAWV